MLQLILGRARTGKSTWVWQAIRARAAAGQRSLLLVPEQFAATADLGGYVRLGDELHGFLKVCSFSTLTTLIEDRFGGGALRSITDAGRMVLMRRTLSALGEQIVCFHRSRRSARFCADCSQALQQLKYCGVSPQLLERAAEAADEARAARLRELALIYRVYEQAREATGLEPVDRLSRAAACVEDAFFADTACFVDGFGEFTAPEAALLRRMLRAAPALYVTLTCPDERLAHWRFTVFAPAAATARHLYAQAAAEGVQPAPAVVLRCRRRFEQPLLAQVEQLLAAGDGGTPLPPMEDAFAAAPANGDTPAVLCYAADSLYQEAMYVAARAAALAREGVAYGQMAVLCRDPAVYLPALQYAFGLYGVPLFTGSTLSAEYAPMAVFLRAALVLAKGGLSGEGVLALLKTGLAGVDEPALSALENYVYTWRPTAQDWRAPFTRDPAGMDAGEPDEARQAQLALIEGVRARIVPLIEAFRAGRGTSGRQMSAALYRLLEAVGAPQVVGEWARAEAAAGSGLGGFDSARMWQTVIGFLDEMAALLGDEPITPAEYDELLCVLLRTAEIGQAPHTQNEVQLAAADRARLDSPGHVFVMGLNEGVFPAPVGDSPLLTNDDRAALSALGAPLSGNYEDMVLREEMHLYRALSSARCSLTLSWLATKEGAPQQPCAPVRRLCAAMGLAPVRPHDAALALTPAAALELLAARWREDSPAAAALYAALAPLPEMAPRLHALQQAAAGAAFSVTDTAALRRLLGGTVYISPSRMESYYECPFGYFLQYVLQVRPRPRAELGVPQSGTLVHWLLEELLRTFPALEGLSDERLRAEVEARVQAYAAQKLPAGGRRLQYLLQRIADNAVRLLGYIRDELAQGRFVPCALEQPVGAPGAPALEVCGAFGQKVRIVGTVDRVDTMTVDGRTYLRVVDYKTGSKSFSLDDVWSGINTQMLLYLFALTRTGAGPWADALPAGVLYLLSDPAPSPDARRSLFSVDGLVLDDEAVLVGMDAEGSGRYLPALRFVDGRPVGDKLVTLSQLGAIAARLEQLVAAMADALYEGQIPARPLRHGSRLRCAGCDYRPVCRRREGDPFAEMPRGQWKAALAAANEREEATV